MEHLVQDLHDKSSMQEFTHSFQGSVPMSPKNRTKSDNKRRSAVLESKLQEFEIEMERLSSRIEHLKSQNEVLILTLTESKNHCDNLTVLIGKYESNHTAQQLVISYLDQMIELFEGLVTILETEVPHPDHDVDKVIESKRQAENKVKSLIKSMDSVTRPDSGLALPSSMDSGPNASWDDSSGYSQNSSLGNHRTTSFTIAPWFRALSLIYAST